MQVVERHEGGDRRRALFRRRSRSACSSSAGSGRRTRRSTVASATRICRSGRSPIPTPASIARAAACCSAPTFSTVPMPMNSRRCRRTSASPARSNLAPPSIRNTSTEFESGIAVAWHRVPFTLGCAGNWTDDARTQHYRNLCQIDGTHRAGRRACVRHSRLAGGRHPVRARRHHPPARARGEDVMEAPVPR